MKRFAVGAIAILLLAGGNLAIAEHTSIVGRYEPEPGEKVTAEIGGRAVAVEHMRGRYGVGAYKIVFYDAKGKVVRIHKVYPPKARRYGRSNLYGSSKYVAVAYSYGEGDRPDAGQWHQRLSVIDMDGRILWEREQKLGSWLFFDDDRGSLLILDPYSAAWALFTVHGRELGDGRFSDWSVEPLPEDEAPILYRFLGSYDGKYVAVSRSDNLSAAPFYELSLLDLAGKRAFQVDVRNGLHGQLMYVSSRCGKVVVFEYRWDEKGTGIERLVGYSFLGIRLWEVATRDGASYEGFRDIEPSWRSGREGKGCILPLGLGIELDLERGKLDRQK
jgi:hypothetical protein